jgi:DnaJ-class molecular chaperone
MAVLVLIVLILGGGYFASLRLHPLRRCPVCKNTPGRHHGAIYGYAYRPCRACGGRGRKDRLGTKIFFGGTNDSGSWG